MYAVFLNNGTDRRQCFNLKSEEPDKPFSTEIESEAVELRDYLADLWDDNLYTVEICGEIDERR